MPPWTGLPPPPPARKRSTNSGVGLDRAVAVADARGELDRLRPEAGDEDRRRRRPAACRCARSRRCSASPWWLNWPPFHSAAHDLDRLLEHLQAHVGLGPVVAQDVLVERLAGADAEREAAVEQDGRRGRGLGDDRRVDAHRRAGHAGGDVHAGRRLGERADHRPHERRSGPARRSRDGSGRRSTGGRARPPGRAGPARAAAAVRYSSHDRK